MKIQKTFKLFINGEFPRSESGRVFPVHCAASADEIYANLPLSSRKDFRASVEAARAAQKSWSKRSAYNRCQILYRMAEMCEGKKPEFSEIFSQTLGWSAQKSDQATTSAIDAFVYFAGFCDKFQQITGAVNPVNGPYHNFTTPEPVGVVALVCGDRFQFENLIADICGVIASGNSLVVLLGKGCPAILGPLGEVFATSDLPGGVVNLLTGELTELLEVISSHMEVEAISFQNENVELLKSVSQNATQNMKRVVALRPQESDALSIERILDFIEYKTVWHPIGV